MEKQKQIDDMAVEKLVAFLWNNTAMYDEDLIFDVAEAIVNEGYSKREWHDVSSDPPKESGLYIVCTERGSRFTAHYYADCGRFNAPFGKSAKLWTFMPELPKGKENV